METLEKLNQFTEEIQEIITISTGFYKKIKDNEILMANGKPYNNHDKKCLALFMSILYNDNEASKLLGDFDITYKKVAGAIGIKKNNVKTCEKYLLDFINLVDSVKDSSAKTYTRDLSPTTLLANLMVVYECASYFLEDIYRKLGLIHPNEQVFDHESFDYLTKALEKDENDRFLNLEQASSLKQVANKPALKPASDLTKSNKCLSAKLGLNPYNIDLSFGRDEEVKKLMISLLMTDKSVMLVGPSGVGKTAIVEGFAHRIASKQVPDIFLDKKIISLNVASLVSGCKYVGMFEEKLTKLLDELEQEEDVIVFIDEIHSIIGAGKGGNNSNDMANILKPYLDSGKIKIIGTTTTEEYEKHISKDPGLKRRFEIVNVKEPDMKTLEAICYNVIYKLQQEMDILFLEDTYMAEAVIKELIKATDKKYRVYNDVVNNPNLIISIITRSFAVAKYYGKDIVEIEDLIEALQESERLYPARMRLISSKLKALKPVNHELVQSEDNVIEFPKKKLFT